MDAIPLQNGQQNRNFSLGTLRDLFLPYPEALTRENYRLPASTSIFRWPLGKIQVSRGKNRITSDYALSQDILTVFRLCGKSLEKCEITFLGRVLHRGRWPPTQAID
jgi:hypothetical protein